MTTIPVVAALLLLMAVAASSLPNSLADSKKRTAESRPSPATSRLSVERGRRPLPQQADKAVSSRTAVPSENTRRKPQASRRPARPSTTPSTTTTTEGREDVTEEIRKVGVNGWLAAPTEAPLTPIESRTEPTPTPAKPGLCESPKGFGIKCMSRLDQCSYDSECPGATKCCMVGECGYLCVKPKPTSNEAKQPTKAASAKSKGSQKLKSSEKAEEESTQETPIESKEAEGDEEQEESAVNYGEREAVKINRSTTGRSISTTAKSSSDVTTEAEATLQSPSQV